MCYRAFDPSIYDKTRHSVPGAIRFWSRHSLLDVMKSLMKSVSLCTQMISSHVRTADIPRNLLTYDLINHSGALPGRTRLHLDNPSRWHDLQNWSWITVTAWNFRCYFRVLWQAQGGGGAATAPAPAPAAAARNVSLRFHDDIIPVFNTESFLSLERFCYEDLYANNQCT